MFLIALVLQLRLCCSQGQTFRSHWCVWEGVISAAGVSALHGGESHRWPTAFLKLHISSSRLGMGIQTKQQSRPDDDESCRVQLVATVKLFVPGGGRAAFYQWTVQKCQKCGLNVWNVKAFVLQIDWSFDVFYITYIQAASVSHCPKNISFQVAAVLSRFTYIKKLTYILVVKCAYTQLMYKHVNPCELPCELEPRIYFLWGYNNHCSTAPCRYVEK